MHHNRVTKHLGLLADAVQAVDGLLLGRLVPPRLKDIDRVGCCQVQAHTAGLERHQQHHALRVVLEPLDHGAAVGGRPGHHGIVDALLGEHVAHYLDAGDEVEEHHHLVPVADGLEQAVAQRVELGRAHTTVSQALGNRRSPAQLGQRLEHDELGRIHPFVLERVVDHGLVETPPLLVEVLVLVAHLDRQRLVGAGGQLGEHVALEASQDEGEHLAAQRGGRLLVVVALDGRGEAVVEVLQRAEHRRVEKAEQRVELDQVVLDGCAAQGQPVLGLEQGDGLGRLRGDILDVLRLVEDDVVELVLEQLLDVVAHQGVCGEHQLALECLVQVALRAIIDGERQLWGKPLQLVLPVEQQAAGHHQQRRALDLGVDACQHGDGLQSLAQAHVIGQAAAQVVLIEVVEPLDTLLLIVAQRGIDLTKLHALLGQVVEPLKHAVGALGHLAAHPLAQHRLDLGQVEERDLHLAVLFGRAREQTFQALHELLVDEGAVAIGERDVVRLLELRQQVVDAELLVAQADRRAALQKVDARAQAHVQTRPHWLELEVEQLVRAQQVISAQDAGQSLGEEGQRGARGNAEDGSVGLGVAVQAAGLGLVGGAPPQQRRQKLGLGGYRHTLAAPHRDVAVLKVDTHRDAQVERAHRLIVVARGGREQHVQRHVAVHRLKDECGLQRDGVGRHLGGERDVAQPDVVDRRQQCRQVGTQLRRLHRDGKLGQQRVVAPQGLDGVDGGAAQRILVADQTVERARPVGGHHRKRGVVAILALGQQQ